MMEHIERKNANTYFLTTVVESCRDQNSRLIKTVKSSSIIILFIF